jgi:hypothetical protein
MDQAVGPAAGGATGTLRPGLALLRGVLGLQIVLGLVWGIAMLFFAPMIVLGDPYGPHIEKIAMEGGAHLMLVLAALLVWRASSLRSTLPSPSGSWSPGAALASYRARKSSADGMGSHYSQRQAGKRGT